MNSWILKKIVFSLNIWVERGVLGINMLDMNKKNSANLYKHFKETTKLYFLCAVIILFNMGIYKSAISTYSFGKLVFCLSALFVFSACSVSNYVVSWCVELCRVIIPYLDKFWRWEKLALLAQNGKNRQIKSAPIFFFFLAAPNLIIFSLRQIRSMAKKLFF